MANKVILAGNLGKDVELRYTLAGAAVASFYLATTERYKDKDGNKQEKTEWHNIVMWRQLAELASKYLQKGSKIYLEGKIQTRSYDDKDGNKRYVTEIIADQMEFLGGNQQTTHQQKATQQQAPRGYEVGMRPQQSFNPDDEIPF